MKKYICMSRKAVPKCPIHRVELQMRDGRYGEFWGCPAYPECSVTATWSKFDNHYHISDRYLRSARKLAHEVLDKLWLEKHAPRGAVYRWLSDQLGIRSHKVCHIQHFNIEQCRKTVGICVDMLIKCRCKQQCWKLSVTGAMYMNVYRNHYMREAITDVIHSQREFKIAELWGQMSAEERSNMLCLSHEDYQSPIRGLLNLDREDEECESHQALA